MEIKLRKHGSIYIIDIIGEMDLYNSYKLKDITKNMILKNITDYIINLESLEYIDSSGIGAIIFVNDTLQKKGLNLKICNVHGSVRKVIELTKLMGYFPIVETLDDAIKELS